MTTSFRTLRLLPLLLLGLAATPAAQKGRNEADYLRRPRLDRVINVASFGARGDGRADDTLAFVKALRAARTQVEGGFVGNILFLPKGTYRITSPLAMGRVRGLEIRGAGVLSTRLLWAPSGEAAEGEGDPGFLCLEDASDCTVADLALVNGSADVLPSGIHCLSAGLVSTAGNVLRNVLIEGGAGGVQRAVRFTVAAETLESSSHHRLERVQVRNYLDAGFSLESKLVRDIQFEACRFEGETRGLAGVSTRLGDEAGVPSNEGGSFRWNGGGGGGNRGTDFDLGEAADVISINGGQFAGSARFLNSGGPSGNQWPLLIEGVVWLDDRLGDYEDSPWPVLESLRVVNFQFRGPLVMTGNQFGTPPDPIQGPQVAKPLEVIWNPGNNFGEFIFVGNYLATSKANPFFGLTETGATRGIYPNVQQGNIVEAEDFGSNTSVKQMPVHLSSLSGSATPTVGWLNTNRRLFVTGAHQPVNALLHGVVGQEILIFAEGDRTFVSGPSLRLAGGLDFAMKAGDNLTLAMIEDGVWREVARTVQ